MLLKLNDILAGMPIGVQKLGIDGLDSISLC